RAGKDFTGFRKDRCLRKDYISRFLEHSLSRVDNEGIVHRFIIEFPPRWPGRANGIDVSALLQPCAFEEWLERVRRGHDHVGSPHGRFEVHSLCAVQLSKTLGVVRRPTPHPYLVELAHMPEGLQMCARLHAARKERKDTASR